jgi:hypothetical protein
MEVYEFSSREGLKNISWYERAIMVEVTKRAAE